MTNIAKAHFDVDGDNVRLSMPFAKVDSERRIVSGFATLDNLDKQLDVVTPEASLNAFSKFRGNIREMHQPSAVGKMVSFKEDKYFDPETKKFYSGIYVSAYVSKGAQDCWEKVLDGTYSGFSIGGKMNKWEDAFDEKMESPIRIIKDYTLVELSLVDNPANQFASILSVQKVDGVDTLKGDAVDTVIENVFWDKESGLVTLSENETVASPVSGVPMQNIGFVEKSDDDKTNMIKFLVDSAKGIDVAKMNKENDNMSDEIVNDEIVDVAPEAEAVVEAVAEDVEKAAMPEDGATAEGEEDATESSTDEEEEVAKKSDEISDLKNIVTSAFSDITSVIKSFSDELAEVKKSVAVAVEKADVANAKIADAESDFNNLGKSVTALQADTAFRKSGDLGEIVQEPAMVEKSVWGGRFLNSADLLK
jgi:uncharacterized protein YjcR